MLGALLDIFGVESAIVSAVMTRSTAQLFQMG